MHLRDQFKMKNYTTMGAIFGKISSYRDARANFTVDDSFTREMDTYTKTTSN